LSWRFQKRSLLEYIFHAKKEELESFDYVTIKYLKEQSEYILYDDDFIIAAIRPFKNLLEKALNLELQLKANI